jgi:hypothetical protein
MIRYVTGAVGALIFAFGAWAQTSPPQHQHNVAAPNLIDGAVRPDLIPDSVAYRLYLVTVSTGRNPTESAQKDQRAKVAKTGLDDTDQHVLTDILSDFRTKYDDLVSEYNSAARAALARNESQDIRGLLKEIDKLVQSTRDAIDSRLSPRGSAKLHSFVMAEKKNMKVTED